jgi:DGQHR domain-containing protein
MSRAAITQGLSLAALRGEQGSRTLYQVFVENSVLNNFFTVNMDPPQEKSQRQLDPKHARDIANYILENPDEYVMGALIYAVDKDCMFTPSEMSDAMGVLTIPFGTNLRSLDGQHRRAGLNDAIAEDPEVSADYTAVLIYVEPDVTRRRQMFSDMNATPKVVAKALNVKFDHRDPFARAAQFLAADHPFLSGVVEMDAMRVSATSDKWYSLGAIWDALKRLQVGSTGRVRNPSQYAEADITKRGEQFFDLLDEARPEFEEVRSGTEDINVLRSRTILFSSTTLRAIAGAAWMRLSEDGYATDMSEYIEGLARIDFAPNAKIWLDTGFVSPGKSTPNARNQEVLAATRAIADEMRRHA